MKNCLGMCSRTIERVSDLRRVGQTSEEEAPEGEVIVVVATTNEAVAATTEEIIEVEVDSEEITSQSQEGNPEGKSAKMRDTLSELM